MFPSKDASVHQLVAVLLGTRRNFAWEACACHTECASGCVIRVLFDASSSGLLVCFQFKGKCLLLVCCLYLSQLVCAQLLRFLLVSSSLSGSKLIFFFGNYYISSFVLGTFLAKIGDLKELRRISLLFFFFPHPKQAQVFYLWSMEAKSVPKLRLLS